MGAVAEKIGLTPVGVVPIAVGVVGLTGAYGTTTGDTHHGRSPGGQGALIASTVVDHPVAVVVDPIAYFT